MWFYHFLTFLICLLADFDQDFPFKDDKITDKEKDSRTQCDSCSFSLDGRGWNWFYSIQWQIVQIPTSTSSWWHGPHWFCGLYIYLESLSLPVYFTNNSLFNNIPIVSSVLNPSWILLVPFNDIWFFVFIYFPFHQTVPRICHSFTTGISSVSRKCPPPFRCGYYDCSKRDCLWWIIGNITFPLTRTDGSRSG